MSNLDVFKPTKLGPITLRNKFIKAATYENLARGGLVTDGLIDFHVMHAEGGLGMTTVAYCAVESNGRTDGEQIIWNEEARPGLRKLTDAVHNTGAAVSAQVGHAGYVNNPAKTGGQSIGPSPYFQRMSFSKARAATYEDITRISDLYVNAAKMAIETGFDAIEVHLGHNYLFSSFFSPMLNKREDQYGGSLENRARLARDVLNRIREVTADKIAVIAKMNMKDTPKKGLQLAEAIEIAKMIDQDGTVDAFEMTEGSSLLDPLYLFHGDVPLKEFAEAMPPLMRIPTRLFGGSLLKKYEYTPDFLLEDALQVKKNIKTPMILLGGVDNMDAVDRALEAGFGYVAMGRVLLREPDIINRWQRDRSVKSLCDHNNTCMATVLKGKGSYCTRIPESERAGVRIGERAFEAITK